MKIPLKIEPMATPYSIDVGQRFYSKIYSCYSVRRLWRHLSGMLRATASGTQTRRQVGARAKIASGGKCRAPCLYQSVGAASRQLTSGLVHSVHMTVYALPECIAFARQPTAT